MSEPVRYRWRFNAEDDDGESHALLLEDAPDFISTAAEASRECDRLADEWETRTGGMVVRLECERRGKAGGAS